MPTPEPTHAAGVALLVLNVAGVPGIIRSVGDETPRHEAYGYGLALAVGAASSWLARTPWPLLGTAAMCALMLHLRKGTSVTSPADESTG